MTISNRLKKKIVRNSLKIIENHNTKHRHITFLCDGNRIVCWGINQTRKSHPLSAKYNYRFSTIHSELDCLRKFPYPLTFLQNYILINVRINRSNELCLAKPCKNCLKLLSAFNVTNMWFSNDKGDFVQ